MPITYLKHLPDFAYFAPGDIKEACWLLEERQERAKLMAGGTDLLINMKQGKVTPQYVIGLKNITGLDGIYRDEPSVLRLGALTSHRAISENLTIRQKFTALAVACSKVGTPQVRNMATVGGNLCNAAPAADSAPPLLAMGAKVKLVSLRGERVVLLEDFFTGPGKTLLQSGELLSEILIAAPPVHSGTVYLKLPARTAVDIAAVGISVFLALDSDGETCCAARIVLGAVAPTPFRAGKAEKVILGSKVNAALIRKAGQAALEECRPISDVRASKNYRTEMVRTLTRQAIGQAWEQAKMTFNKA